MIIIKKDILLNGDFSTCLSSLWKYELKNPDDPSDLIVRSIQVRKNYLERLASGELIDGILTIQEDEEILNQKIDSQSVQGHRQAIKTSNDNNTSTTASASSKESKQRPPLKKQSTGYKFIPTFFRKDTAGDQQKQQNAD